MKTALCILSEKQVQRSIDAKNQRGKLHLFSHFIFRSDSAVKSGLSENAGLQVTIDAETVGMANLFANFTVFVRKIRFWVTIPVMRKGIHDWSGATG